MQIKKVTNPNNLLEHLHIFDKNISCKIFPNLGASLQEFQLNNVKIIDGISIDNSGLEDYKNTYKSSILFPFPNRVKDGIYIFKQEAYQLKINEKQLNNAIHGLVFDKSFIVEQSDVKGDQASATLSYNSDGSLSGFPFLFKFSVTYIINTQGDVTVRFMAENTDTKSFPFGFGWHPYFVGENLAKSTLSFKGKEQFINSDRNIPIEFEPIKLEDSFLVGNQFFDDAFTMKSAEVLLEDSNYKLDVDFENKTDGYVQIYTPPHRKTIAIEPMTCPADAFNNKYGLKVLDPKETYSWNMKLKVQTKV
jgi:aldose 1-epimerase